MSKGKMQVRSVFLTVTVVVLFNVNTVVCYDKRWLHTSLWSDPSNWKPQNTPCASGSVQLKDGVVFISNETSQLPSEIVLSTDGEVVLPRDSVIKLGPLVNAPTSSPEENCGESIFTVAKRSWYNPQNWQVIADDNSTDIITNTVPYIERIPCKNDGILFPAHDSFSVLIDEDGDISVASVTLKGNLITNNSGLQNYMSTVRGKENFMMNEDANLVISLSACPKEGCICRHHKKKEKICSSFNCPSLKCERKVLPSGDCCSHCGAILDFDYDEGFEFSNCTRAVKTILASSSNHVQAYLSRISSKKIEILFTDGGDGSEAQVWMKKIGDEMKQPGHVCAAKNVVELTWKDFLKDEDEKDVNPTTVTLAVIIPLAFIAIVIICLAVYFRKRRMRKSFFKPKQLDEMEERDITDYPGFNEVLTTDFTSVDYDKDLKRMNSSASSGGEVKANHSFANPSFSMGELDLDDDKDFLTTQFDYGLNPLYDEVQVETKVKKSKKSKTELPVKKDAGKDTDLLPNNQDPLPSHTETATNDGASPEGGKKGIPNPLYSEVWTVFGEGDSDAEMPTNNRWETDDSKIVDVSDVRPLYDDDMFE